MDHAVTAVACNGLDCYFVNESHNYLLYKIFSTQRREDAKGAKSFVVVIPVKGTAFPEEASLLVNNNYTPLRSLRLSVFALISS